MQLLLKAHVKTYQRTNKAGQVVTVQEHEDKRQAARQQAINERAHPSVNSDVGQDSKPQEPEEQPAQQDATAEPLPAFKPIPHPTHEDQVSAWLEAVMKEPDIVRAMQENRTGTPTDHLYKLPNGTYTPERTQIHEAIVASMLNPKAVPKEGAKPHAIILMGCPGAGKTSTLAPIASEYGVEFTTVNADDVKAKLPEYTGSNAGLLHEESSDIAEGMLMNRVFDANHNVVMDITGSNGVKVKKMVEIFHAKGYDISIAYAHLPAWKAATRVVDRFRGSGRFVPPHYVVNKVDGNPEETYNTLKNDPRVAHWRRYNNDVDKGTAAPLTDSGRRQAGHLTKSVGHGSVGTNGRISQRQDSGNAQGYPALRRAYRLHAQLTKSVIYLTDDLASPDLDPVSRGVLLAERLHSHEQLTALTERLEAVHAQC